MQPITLDISSDLVEGKNLIAVHVHNPSPFSDIHFCSTEVLPVNRMISLLAELKTDTCDTPVCTDDSWIVTDIYQKDWMKPAYYPAAERHDPSYDLRSAARGTWLYAWERGKPPLHPWGNPDYFGEKMVWPQKVFYQIVLPVGTVRIDPPEISGSFTLRLDGVETDFSSGNALQLRPLPRTRILEIDVLAENENDGLKEPIHIKLSPVPVPYGEWSSLGLPWFSGRAVYRNHFQVRADRCSTVLHGDENSLFRYILQWEQKNSCAEIWINHKLVKVCLWEPYRADITEYVLPGTNDIAIVIANLAAPARRILLVDEGQALGWNRYWNEDNIDRESEDLVSGLTGPIRIYCYEENIINTDSAY